MTGPRKGVAAAAMAAGIFLAVIGPAEAHPFNVYATTDCVTITVMASINDGQVPSEGAVTLMNGDDVVVATTELVGNSGKVEISLDGLDITGGIRAEVASGAHSDYWVLTPEDMARNCSS